MSQKRTFVLHDVNIDEQQTVPDDELHEYRLVRVNVRFLEEPRKGPTGELCKFFLTAQWKVDGVDVATTGLVSDVQKVLVRQSGEFAMRGLE